MALMVVIIVCCVYVVFSLKSQKELDINKIAGVNRSSNKKQIAAKLLKENIDYTSFVASVSSKKIFAQPVEKKQDDQKAKALLEAKNQLKSLKLVGVLGQSEKKAIIEDTSSNTTLYAYFGDILLGKFTVKHISSSALTLEFEGNDFSLNL